MTPEQEKPTVTVKGPLGELSLRIPPFVHLEHDPATKKVVVSVEDREIRAQREMWGMCLLRTPAAGWGRIQP